MPSCRTSDQTVSVNFRNRDEGRMLYLSEYSNLAGTTNQTDSGIAWDPLGKSGISNSVRQSKFYYILATLATCDPQYSSTVPLFDQLRHPTHALSEIWATCMLTNPRWGVSDNEPSLSGTTL